MFNFVMLDNIFFRKLETEVQLIHRLSNYTTLDEVTPQVEDCQEGESSYGEGETGHGADGIIKLVQAVVGKLWVREHLRLINSVIVKS